MSDQRHEERVSVATNAIGWALYGPQDEERVGVIVVPESQLTDVRRAAERVVDHLDKYDREGL